MTCTETYLLPCGEPCGWVNTGISAPSDGRYVVTWIDGGVTYTFDVYVLEREEIRFLWPFGTHGSFTFQITDSDGVVLTYTEDLTEYDCFQIVGIPTKYDIDPGELAALEAICNPA